MKPSSVAVTILIIAVVCYFAFPILFILPLMLVFGRVPPDGVREVVRVVFKPIIMIGEFYPPYRDYLMWQERLMTAR